MITSRESERSASKGLNFSVMSYNILAQDLVENNIYLYRDADAENLTWSVRRKKIFREIKQQSPDVSISLLFM